MKTSCLQGTVISKALLGAQVMQYSWLSRNYYLTVISKLYIIR